jgi:replicative DNA helicase
MSSPGLSQQAPYSQEAEEAVLGAIMINPESFLAVASFLNADDFFILRHGYIWEAMARIVERSDRLDTLTVQEELRAHGRLNDIGGPAYLMQLINNTPTSVHAEVYGRLVERAALRRRLLTAADEIKSLAMDETLTTENVTTEAESRLFRVTERNLRRDIVPMREAVIDYYDKVEHLIQHQDEPLGLPTGFRDLNELLGGLQRSDLLIFAGRPGMGKTSFLLSVALNAANIGARIAIFTMEMGTEQIIQRFISMDTGINTQKLRLGQLTPQEWQRFVQSSGRLGNLRIWIDDTPAMTPLQLRTKCRRLAHEFGLDLVVLDYIQLMNAGSGYENNRVQEISYISRNLKEMARELNVPLFTAAQLSRAVEQRQDKRPQLSDLRESGCLTGETLIYLPDEGVSVPIRELEGQSGFNVLSLNTQTWKLEAAQVSNAFCTGVKPVYKMTTRLGRTIRATGNHPFLTICGWKRLDELTTDDHIAVPRTLPSPEAQTMTDAELALLGHLLGDGCTLPTHAIQYTTREPDIAEIVAGLAKDVFGSKVVPRIHKEPGRNWYQVFLPPSYQLTHGVHNQVRVWLDELGAFGLRSYEKFVPEKVFRQPADAIAVFLRHLWATDGCINLKLAEKTHHPTVYYASSSERLARDVQMLLLRLGINARISRISQNGKGRDQFHVGVSGKDDIERFLDIIGVIGDRRLAMAAEIKHYLSELGSNTNRDIIPRQVWRTYAVPAMAQISLSNRQMQAQLGNQYCGTGLYKQNISRDRASRLAQVVQSEEIGQLAQSDVYWDGIAAIEPDGEAEVFDLTVPGLSNFTANNVIAHNSLEQDADIVMFLYRDVVYNEATEFPNRADIIIAKHRNGPTGTISLHFEKSLTKFADARTSTIDLSNL